MFKKIIVLSFLLSFFFNFGQSHLLSEGKINKKNYLEVIPFEIENKLIIIPIEINQKKYRFLLDTGAPNTINKNTFKEFSKKASVDVNDSNNSKEKLFIVNIPSYKVGSLEFTDFNFMELDFSKNFIFNCLNLDGILGSNSFKDSVIKIDYKNKKLTISNHISSIPTSSPSKKLQLVAPQKMPFLEIQLADENKIHQENVLLDTGYRGFYSQSEKSFSAIKKLDIPKNVLQQKAQISVGVFGIEPLSEKSILTIPNLNIGKINFKNVSTFTSSDSESKLGNEFLEYGAIILDFKKEKWYFENYNSTEDLKTEYSYYKLVYNEGKMIVGMVIHPKLKNSIAVGDVVLEVDNEDLMTITCEKILNLKEAKEKISILHDNKKIDIDIKNLH